MRSTYRRKIDHGTAYSGRERSVRVARRFAVSCGSGVDLI